MASRRRAGSSASRSRIGKAEPAATARETAALRALLERAFAGLNGRAVDVSDASEPVRAFWEVLGWSPFFAASLEPPETIHATVTAKQLLSEYVLDPHFQLRLPDLPKRYRVVQVDSQGLGFTLTDEDSGDDPALLCVSQQLSTITRAGPSYLAHCSETLIGLAFSRIYRATLLPRGVFDLGGQQLLPLLAPGVRQIAEGVWLLSEQQTPAGRRIELAHSSTEALIGWLRDLPNTIALTLELLFSGQILKLSDGFEVELADVRTLGNETGGITYRIGSLGEESVIHWKDPAHRAAELLVSYRQRRKVAAAVGVKLGEGLTLCCWESLHGTRGLLAPPPGPSSEAAAVERALSELEALLFELAPEHAQTRRSLELELDAPRDVRALWRIVGESALTKRVVSSPDRATGERVLEGALSRWMQDAATRDRWQGSVGSDPRLVLPSQRRLAAVHVPSMKYDYLVANSSYLAVTDESDGSPDPAVLELTPTMPEPRFLPAPYVAHVAKELLGKAFAKCVGPAAAPAVSATLPFAPLLNDVWLVARGVYCVRGAVPARGAVRYVARFRSLREYYAYAITLSDDVLVEAPQGADSVSFELPKQSRLAPEQAAAAGFRVLERAEGSSLRRQYALGILDNVPLWLEWAWLDHQLRGARCVTAQKDRARVERLLQSLAASKGSH